MAPVLFFFIRSIAAAVVLTGFGVVLRYFNGFLLRLRDCLDCRRCFPRRGELNDFEDFELLVLVHEAFFSSAPRCETCIRLTAGSQQVKSRPSMNAKFFDNLPLLVPRGTDSVRIDLLHSVYHTVLATVKLSMQDVLETVDQPAKDMVLAMQPKVSDVLVPCVRLTLQRDSASELDGLLVQRINTNGIEPSQPMKWCARQPVHEADLEEVYGFQDADIFKPGVGIFDLNMASSDAESSTDIERGSSRGGTEDSGDPDDWLQGCEGHAELFGSWGMKSPIYLTVLGPPRCKTYSLVALPDKESAESRTRVREQASVQVELSKIKLVQTDLILKDVLSITYAVSEKVTKLLTIRMAEDARDTWVHEFRNILEEVRLKETANNNPQCG